MEVSLLAGSGAHATVPAAQADRTAALLVIQEMLATAQLLPVGAPSLTQVPDTRKQGPDVAAPEADQDARRGPSRSASDAAAALNSLPAGRQQQPHAADTKPSEGPQETSSKPAVGRPCAAAAKTLKVGLELEGLHASFDAEAIFAACQIAADVKAVQAVLAAPVVAARVSLPSTEPAPASERSEPPSPAAASPAAAKWKATVAAATGKAAAAAKGMPHASPRGSPKKASRAPKLDLQLAVRLGDLRGDMWLADDVCWGVHIGAVTAAYASRCVVVERVTLTLHDAPLIHLAAAVATVQLPGALEPAAPDADPWAAFGSAEAEDAADLGRVLTGGSLVAASPLAEAAADEHAELEVASHVDSQVTDLTLDDGERTLSRQTTAMSTRWQDIAEMGSGSEVGEDATPMKRVESGPSLTDPLPQRPFGLGLERLPAAYLRAGLTAWADGLAMQVCND